MDNVKQTTTFACNPFTPSNAPSIPIWYNCGCKKISNKPVTPLAVANAQNSRNTRLIPQDLLSNTYILLVTYANISVIAKEPAFANSIGKNVTSKEYIPQLNTVALTPITTYISDSLCCIITSFLTFNRYTTFPIIQNSRKNAIFFDKNHCLKLAIPQILHNHILLIMSAINKLFCSR